jgi:hypothetical protein
MQSCRCELAESSCKCMMQCQRFAKIAYSLDMTTAYMQEDLIDRIYECSFVPELWPQVLDELAQLAQARGGQLFAVRDKVMSWITSANLTEVFQAYVFFSRARLLDA